MVTCAPPSLVAQGVVLLAMKNTVSLLDAALRWGKSCSFVTDRLITGPCSWITGKISENPRGSIETALYRAHFRLSFVDGRFVVRGNPFDGVRVNNTGLETAAAQALGSMHQCVKLNLRTQFSQFFVDNTSGFLVLSCFASVLLCLHALHLCCCAFMLCICVAASSCFASVLLRLHHVKRCLAVSTLPSRCFWRMASQVGAWCVTNMFRL
jgi:hypothetical protein